MLISMASNKLILSTFSFKETSMFDTVTASLSTHLKTHSKPSVLPSPIMPTLNFTAERLCLSSSTIPKLNFNAKKLRLSPSNPIFFLEQSCDGDHRLHSSAVRTGSSGVARLIPNLLERPAYDPKQEMVDYEEDENEEEIKRLSDLLNDEDEEDGEQNFDNWVDWEDEILRETQSLKRYVQLILHSPRYKSGEKLTPQDEKIILEKLLPYHPEFEEKAGPGVDFISVGNHPDYLTSRCLLITRKDGKLVDFSFWKCLRGLVWKKYPLYAETFIEKYLRPRR